MFYHPLFREWLIRRRDNDSTKFMVDPRNGHLAIALTYSRNSNTTQLNGEKMLDLCHHMLKAHVYRNHPNAKDLQSTWLCQVANVELLSQALGSTRNIYCPNANVSRLLLLAGASPHYVGGLMQNAPLLALFAHEGKDALKYLRYIEYRQVFSRINFEMYSYQIDCIINVAIILKIFSMIVKSSQKVSKLQSKSSPKPIEQS